MNFKRYHVSRNLFDKTDTSQFYDHTALAGEYWAYSSQSAGIVIRIPCKENTTYTLACDVATSVWRISLINTDSTPNSVAAVMVNDIVRDKPSGGVYSFTTASNTKYILFQAGSSVFNDAIDNIMLNEGSTALPYEPYDTEVWHDISHYIHNTSTDTITTLPAVIYANDTTATAGLKGNMSQTGTPTPQNPIQPQSCGDLETNGEKAGQYKIPISSANTTTPVYLGEVETTRKIKKYVFTGEESGTIYSTATSRKGIEITGITGIIGGNADITILAICTHYQPNTRTALYRNTDNGISNAYQNDSIIFYDTNCQTVEAFQQFCTQQYTAGTPVTVWYVLAEPTTGIVNEPLMKIGDYADEVSDISIPTIAGANTLSIGTALQPSEVTANYHGWHTGAVHERESGSWD